MDLPLSPYMAMVAGASPPPLGKRKLICKMATGVLLVVAVAVGMLLMVERYWLPSYDAGMDVRVSKGFGTRGYNAIRISVVSTSASPPVAGFFDYSERFMYKWDNLYLHTTLKKATPGTPIHFDMGANFKNLTVRVPQQGSGVAGVLIADPCVNSPIKSNWVPCHYGDTFQTILRTPALINAFVGDADTNFWGILGDNFYDRTGEITWDVFQRISPEAKSKLFVAVPGNHDYWVSGSPEYWEEEDQCGNGFMQYYVQDTKAAVESGEDATPFDFSQHPHGLSGQMSGCNLPAISNSLWYQQIGNIGIVGQSGAYSLDETRPFMLEACAWLGAQPGLELGVLVGHWDKGGLGANNAMAMPGWYSEMTPLPGCAELHARGRLKFFTGHTHCNNPHPRNAEAGFRVAGFGMSDCGDYGIPILDTTNERARIWYFDTSSDYLYDAVIGCVQRKGWRQCTSMATLWLDQPFSHARKDS